MALPQVVADTCGFRVNVSVQATNLVAHVAQTLTELAKAVAL